ncbi:forkhead box protein P1 isoform X1 [Echeneis naucrates]|uniref:forkhead box protein P1 isoform X1 n=1 Tax=Echeneis naucrates TaxID=173247 RepID=UPI001113C7D6|nr:forkhead box protein P1-like isoform X1 [Echeneis naucrates]XP_029361992.1 forkhead box protein P1-like isoform X1 [Echeneis naucrates]
METIKQRQQRPSVLRQVSLTASKPQVCPENSGTDSSCKKDVDAGHCSQSSSPQMSSSLMKSLDLYPFIRAGPKQSSIKASLHDGIPEGTRALFLSGICRRPSCDAVSGDLPSFSTHLHSEHSHGDGSIDQLRIQQDIVQYMENQLILEKQKLIAMQLHQQLSEHKHVDLKAASKWPYNLPLFLPQPQEPDGQQWCIKHVEELSQHGCNTAASAGLLTDLVPSIEFYKYNSIRPPYTYAYLIRWSILESPDKQRTLNEIYNWFTTMFFYFRHNTATWKNAVRHNLSLHKCFVRVEGGKGAVWTVDETEYQRRKGQKYHRDCSVKWLTSYSNHCPADP